MTNDPPKARRRQHHPRRHLHSKRGRPRRAHRSGRRAARQPQHKVRQRVERDL